MSIGHNQSIFLSLKVPMTKSHKKQMTNIFYKKEQLKQKEQQKVIKSVKKYSMKHHEIKTRRKTK